MSKFLAPIHTWLFNKIKVSESLEKSMIQNFALEADDAGRLVLKRLNEQYGSTLSDEPIEDLIDANNIHGWLQDRIHRTEQRGAFLITEIVQRDPENLKRLEDHYYRAGRELAAFSEPTSRTAAEAYKMVHDIVLEGMPCDRVQEVATQSDNRIDWNTTRCLHEHYFQTAGGDVRHYYLLRSALINGMLSNLQGNPTYVQTVTTNDSANVYSNSLTIR